MTKLATKTNTRQLRLTTPVNDKEKKIAQVLAKEGGYGSVAELVRQLLAQRHGERRKKVVAKKVRVSKKLTTAGKTTKRLTLRATKPTPAVSVRKRITVKSRTITGKAAPRRATKKR